VVIQRVCITRDSATNEDQRDAGQTMGTHQVIEYGLFRVHFHVCAAQARKNGITNRDILLLLLALQVMFDHTRSAARPEMVLRRLFVFERDARRMDIESVNGEPVPEDCDSIVDDLFRPKSLPHAALSEMVKAQRKTQTAERAASSWYDYDVTSAEDLKKGLESYPTIRLLDLPVNTLFTSESTGKKEE
jgi:hypothetical protein